MRVVQINSVSGIGSTGRIVEGISTLLNNKNIDNYIYYGVGISSHSNSFKIYHKLNVYFHIILTRLFGKHGFYSSFATINLIRKLRKIDPDIIHLHNLHGHYLNIKILFRFLENSKAKIVWTLHDCWSFTGHCAYFDNVQCYKWQTQCFKCPALKQYPKSLIFDRSREVYRQKNEMFSKIKQLQLIVPSKWMKVFVTESILKLFPTKVIYNGINIETFKPKKNSFRLKHKIEDKFVILGVSNIWENRKGFRYFSELASSLRDDEIVILVGDVDKKQINQNKNILFVGQTDSADELADIYSSADVFVNPTIEDNFPTTNLESMACGTPVIAFDTGGISELINSGTLFITKNKDTQSIRIEIDNYRIKEKGYYFNKCREYIVNNFDIKEKLSEYLLIYDELLRNNNDSLGERNI